VAVYSRIEKSSLHVEMADEAYPVPEHEMPGYGYLDIAGLVAIGAKAGVDAIHPGYGFLSENPNFARASVEAGIAFIGPPAEVISSMANKREARETLRGLGVPVLSGTSGSLDGSADIEEQAQAIGYPVMVKASEGGGGIGLGIIPGPERLSRALRRAGSASNRAFGSDDLYLEKYIPDARHVEVQVLGDKHGNVIHLFERECSVQRRHQKLIEETPAPLFSNSQRAAITEAALTAARGIGYQNAGTFEFLVDPDGKFYFLETNTRLQVEHGITEMTTGFDLVEQQIRVASGEPLDITQSDIRPQGHSLEVRICAEDPDSFLPSPGLLSDWSIPSGDGIRVESGVRAGDEVSSYFDPLIAKILIHADGRSAAIDKMLSTLRNARIEGIKTNVPFHIKALESERFQDGSYTTQLAAQLTAPPS
jgi:acetyl-CoA carboxylase biotin carboxylase subunit